MQEHIPADKLARVYSYDMLGSFVAIPVGAGRGRADRRRPPGVRGDR